MKVARVTSWGSPPVYSSAADLPPPSPDELQLKVVAAGVPRVVRLRAAGKHSSVMNAQLPFDPSVDGVGLDEATGNYYYINSLAAPVFAEYANVDHRQLMQLPSKINPITLAALTNPTASSWMALRCRATGGCQGRVIAILGATSASGRIAAAVARELGAARVIGLARNYKKLFAVEGLDARVPVRDPLHLPSGLGPVNIVLDYVGGPASVQLMQGLEVPAGENLQYIFVGSLAGHENVDLPLRLISSKSIVVLASGVGSLSREDFRREMPGMVGALTRMKIVLDVIPARMKDVQHIWNSEEAEEKRLELVP